MNDDARTGPDRTDEVARRMRALREALAEERARRGGPGFAPDLPSDDGGGAPPREAPAAGETPPGADEPVVRLDALAAVVAGAAETFVEPVNEACRAFAIDTPLRVAHFLAQTAHESALYTALVENLNYGARGLLATWPRRLQGRRGPPRRRPRGRARPAGDAALRRAGGGLVLAGARDQRPLRPRRPRGRHRGGERREARSRGALTPPRRGEDGAAHGPRHARL